MNYGKAIRIVRSAKNISQTDLAELTNFDPSYISLIESNKREPSLRALGEISKKLSVPFHLLTLLASEEKELKHLPENKAEEIGKELLKVLISSQKSL